MPKSAVLSGRNMSSDEDEPAPSPSAFVVARRASREVKSMREESGSDEDAEEPEDWEDDGEASAEEDEREADPIRFFAREKHWRSRTGASSRLQTPRANADQLLHGALHLVTDNPPVATDPRLPQDDQERGEGQERDAPSLTQRAR